MPEEGHQRLQMERMGRCARLAWEHAANERGKSSVPRPEITTGHLLLGVLHEQDCAGGLILARMGLDIEHAYAMTRFVLLHGRLRDAAEEPSVDWAGVPHTKAARDVLDLSLEEANLFTATYPIGTEHLLLGLLRMPGCTGYRMLRYFGIEPEGARATRDELWDLLRLTE